MTEYEIWMEGYVIQGNDSNATFIGKAKGETFKDACMNFEYPDNIFFNETVIVKKGDKLKLDAHYDEPTIWGCRLFDNEKDARASFG